MMAGTVFPVHVTDKQAERIRAEAKARELTAEEYIADAVSHWQRVHAAPRVKRGNIPIDSTAAPNRPAREMAEDVLKE